MKYFFSFLILFFPMVVSAQETLTLQECFDFALNHHESIVIQEQNIRIAEGKFLQAIGQVLPQITAEGSEFLQDNSAFVDSGTSSVGNTFTRFSRPEIRINANQTLFAGFREWHALKAAHSEKSSQTARLENSKRKLFLELATSFYTFLQLSEEYKAAVTTREALEKRLQLMKRRVDLGQSRMSEALATETELALTKATQSDIEGKLENARETLTFLTGKKFSESLEVKDEDDFSDPFISEKNADLLLNQRPDIHAARSNRDAAVATASAQKAIRYPTVSAEANYYPYRVGFQEDIKWDALFTLSIPLFRGGTIRGSIQEAKAKASQAKLTLQEAERKAVLEVKQAQQHFLASQRRFASLKDAQAKGEQNYHVVEKEYQRGITNNLEVLSALKQWQDLKRQYWQAYAQTKINWFTLKVVSGESIP